MLANKDYSQMAIDAKRKSDAKAETEEQKRQAFEAEISKHAQAGQAHFDLGEYLFPFTDLPETDPETGRELYQQARESLRRDAH